MFHLTEPLYSPSHRLSLPSRKGALQGGSHPTPTEANEVFLQTSVATDSAFSVIYGSCFTCPLRTRVRPPKLSWKNS